MLSTSYSPPSSSAFICKLSQFLAIHQMLQPLTLTHCLISLHSFSYLSTILKGHQIIAQLLLQRTFSHTAYFPQLISHSLQEYTIYLPRFNHQFPFYPPSNISLHPPSANLAHLPSTPPVILGYGSTAKFLNSLIEVSFYLLKVECISQPVLIVLNIFDHLDSNLSLFLS